MSRAVAIPNAQEALRLLETGQRAIAEARSIGEVKKIRDQAAAIAMYLRQQQLSEEAARDAAELKVRAERRLGTLLEGEKRGGASNGHPGSLKTLPPDVTHKQSSRWQRVAAVPTKTFERYVEEQREEKAEITTAAVMKLAPKKKAVVHKSKPKMTEEKEEEQKEEDASTALASYFLKVELAIRLADECTILSGKFKDHGALEFARRAAGSWAELVTRLETSS